MRPKPPPKYRILVMMATNMPEALDEALLRPGRIDRIYRVGYPSKAGRIRTYEGYLDKVRTSSPPEQIDKLATITPYATGATIKDLVNEALITAIRDGREVITWRDVMKAKQLKDLGPPEDVEYIERERHAVAVHEACHAVVAYRTRQHMEIDIATIEKGSDYLGMVASIPPEDQFTRWRSEYEADILVSPRLAGRRADVLRRRLVVRRVRRPGVGDRRGLVHGGLLGHGPHRVVVLDGAAARGRQPGRRPRRAAEGREHREGAARRRWPTGSRTSSRELLDQAEAILRENRPSVLAIAHALETHKTLTGEDVEAVVEGREGLNVDGRVYRDPVFVEQPGGLPRGGGRGAPQPHLGEARAAARRAPGPAGGGGGRHGGGDPGTAVAVRTPALTPALPAPALRSHNAVRETCWQHYGSEVRSGLRPGVRASSAP